MMLRRGDDDNHHFSTSLKYLIVNFEKFRIKRFHISIVKSILKLYQFWSTACFFHRILKYVKLHINTEVWPVFIKKYSDAMQEIQKYGFYRWRQLRSQVVEMQEVGNATNPLRPPGKVHFLA